MEIEELSSYTQEELDELDGLMHELSPTSSCSAERLKAVTSSEDSHLYVVREEGHIVASACLCVGRTTEFTLGFVEAVVVSERYRGLHFGRALMEHLMAEADRLGVDTLHLTSNPRRVAANALYKSLGFVNYETNTYTRRARIDL